MAGLPGNSAWVNVGPPLSCNGPSIGSVLIWSPGPFKKPPPLSLQTLYPCDVTVASFPMSRLTPDTAALRIVFPMSNIPPLNMEMFEEVFSLNVLFVIVTVAVPLAVWSSTPPPTKDAELPLNVLLLMVRLAIPLLPLFPTAPPVVAAFPLNALLMMVRLALPPAPPPLLKMPPPLPCWPKAEFPARRQLFTVRVLSKLRMPPPKVLRTDPFLIASRSMITV